MTATTQPGWWLVDVMRWCLVSLYSRVGDTNVTSLWSCFNLAESKVVREVMMVRRVTYRTCNSFFMSAFLLTHLVESEREYYFWSVLAVAWTSVPHTSHLSPARIVNLSQDSVWLWVLSSQIFLSLSCKGQRKSSQVSWNTSYGWKSSRAGRYSWRKPPASLSVETIVRFQDYFFFKVWYQHAALYRCSAAGNEMVWRRRI